MTKFLNSRQRSHIRVFVTAAITAMIFGSLANPVLAASGDYYDVTDQIHYSTKILKSDTTAKPALRAAAKAQHVIVVELSTGLRVDYFKTNNKIAQLMISGNTNIAQIFQTILNDVTLKSNDDVSNYNEPNPSVISISALELHPGI